MRFRIVNHTYPADGTIDARDLSDATLSFAAGLSAQPGTEVKWVPGIVWVRMGTGLAIGHIIERWTVEVDHDNS